MLKKYAAAAVVGGSMLVGGALGVAVFVPHLAGAQAPTTQTPSTPPARAATHGGGGFIANEDPAHEGKEDPQREADENSGKRGSGHGDHHWGGHRGGSNEDPAHEKGESPEREAQENARNGGGSSPQNDPAPSHAY